ncbi:hypothetical protein [Mycobacterium sp. 1164966.3]|uniref:hypothetical protein n=1 Tax=Mycobacterium sp. 1164966.3 TaxID=1856861 RepID=UPI0012E7EC1F|nr:hypothetical protein [Mycobacterium sp. 1164966.3]
MLYATGWPTEIWAVEYTDIRDGRIVDVMKNFDAAQLFIEYMNRNYWAEPILLRSPASFFPARPIDDTSPVDSQTSANDHPDEPKARTFFGNRRRKWYNHSVFRNSGSERR